MQCLIVGADHLGKAPDVLKDKFDVTKTIHWTGRKRNQRVKNIRKLKDLSLIVVYAGYVNHGIVEEVKKFAKKFNIKIIFVNRGLSELA